MVSIGAAELSSLRRASLAVLESMVVMDRESSVEECMYRWVVQRQDRWWNLGDDLDGQVCGGQMGLIYQEESIFAS